MLGTCGNTLNAIRRSAFLFNSTNFCAVFFPKNFTIVGTPFSSATLAILEAGSIPRIGMFFFLKFCNRYPSLLAISTTNEFSFKLNFLMEKSVNFFTCFSHVLENDEKYA